VILYFSRNPNPRLAMAVAKFLGFDGQYEFAAPLAPGQAGRFRPLNPNLLLPILEIAPRPLWEADAIACFLSRRIGATFWRSDGEEPEMIRWISWGKENFVAACDKVNWERATKPRYGIGPCDEAAVEEGLNQFHKSAKLLEVELADRPFLVGDELSYADFRMATFLPFNADARLPIEDYPALRQWYARLEAIEAWRDPFIGLTAPPLPPVPN
tara:strand:- start:126 stop:764 length:639 start_codon:yes stop_codon:yes gene_type:complete